MQALFIGVDGGATKSIIRIEDEAGNVLAEEKSGPASIRFSVENTWHTILSTVQNILSPLGIAFNSCSHSLHAGMGLAGCELADRYQAFLQYPHPFRTLVVKSDAHMACLGAHAGSDGAIIIAGTGTVGYQIQRGACVKIGGFGFPHDDEGSGAWLGLMALRSSLQALDGRLPASDLSRAIFAHFKHDKEHLVAWANQAHAGDFALLAPMVIAKSALGCEAASSLLRQAAKTIEHLSLTLNARQPYGGEVLPCSLLGGIAPYLLPFTSAHLRSRLLQPKGNAAMGAIRVMRMGGG